MTLGSVRGGDIIEADRLGRRFFAIVIERPRRELDVEPIDPRVTYHRVKAREVLGIWRNSRQRASTDADATAAGLSARNGVVA